MDKNGGKTLVLIQNGPVLVDILKKICSEEIPGIKIINIMDESLVRDIIAFGRVTDRITRRVCRYVECAGDLGADAVMMTCSSLCETMDVARAFVDIPVLKINEPMAKEAVEISVKIGVIGTLASVIDPTVRLIKSKAAEIDKKVEIKYELCDEAFRALISGDRKKHDDLLREKVRAMSGDVGVIVLAQGSMAGMTEELGNITGLPVLACLRSGVKAAGKVINKATDRI
ncbi:MAG: aspartate/glutamate racemase family protein [Clostridiales bacterium]|nr:aspartate/glutamate racemase family protein [Clostridiales bacterium]